MTDQQYFILKRLHSLSGVVPVAGFVLFHLFENSNSVAGAEVFNHTVETLRGMPYLYLLEVGLLSPILFHAVVGIWLSFQAKYNSTQFRTRANWSYTLQRATGMALLFFIAFHLYNTRFANIPSDHMFQHMAEGYANPLIFGGYILGIAATAFHLANGLWGFCFSWGIVTGQKSQDALWKVCMGLGVVTFLMGTNAALGFKGKGLDVFQHLKTSNAAASAAVPPTTH
jgi:succinate dehydrogenase / fumarate reductase cytochrome b subunit